MRASWSDLFPGIHCIQLQQIYNFRLRRDSPATTCVYYSFPMDSAQRPPPSLNARYRGIYIYMCYNNNNNNNVARTSSLPCSSFALPLNDIIPTDDLIAQCETAVCTNRAHTHLKYNIGTFGKRKRNNLICEK
jgi:hypothetical protein